MCLMAAMVYAMLGAWLWYDCRMNDVGWMLVIPVM